MLKEITHNPVLTTEENLRAWVGPINALIQAVNTGVIWDNKVAADRAVDQVYNDLPVTVIAEMIDEEYQSVVARLGLETETQNE